jgi:hypothetical protein
MSYLDIKDTEIVQPKPSKWKWQRCYWLTTTSLSTKVNRSKFYCTQVAVDTELEAPSMIQVTFPLKLPTTVKVESGARYKLFIWSICWPFVHETL